MWRSISRWLARTMRRLVRTGQHAPRGQQLPPGSRLHANIRGLRSLTQEDELARPRRCGLGAATHEPPIDPRPPRPAWHPCQPPHLRVGLLPAAPPTALPPAQSASNCLGAPTRCPTRSPSPGLALAGRRDDGGPRSPRLRGSPLSGWGLARCARFIPGARRRLPRTPPPRQASVSEQGQRKTTPFPAASCCCPTTSEPSGSVGGCWSLTPSRPLIRPKPARPARVRGRCAPHAPTRSAPGGILPCPAPHRGAVARPPRARQVYPVCSPRQGTRARVPRLDVAARTGP